MSLPFTDSTMAREQAAKARKAAETEKLPNVRERLLRSAETWDRVAEQGERLKKAAAANTAAKFAGDNAGS